MFSPMVRHLVGCQRITIFLSDIFVILNFTILDATYAFTHPFHHKIVFWLMSVSRLIIIFYWTYSTHNYNSKSLPFAFSIALNLFLIEVLSSLSFCVNCNTVLRDSFKPETLEYEIRETTHSSICHWWWPHWLFRHSTEMSL